MTNAEPPLASPQLTLYPDNFENGRGNKLCQAGR
jgi:hypothetical protein